MNAFVAASEAEEVRKNWQDLNSLLPDNTMVSPSYVCTVQCISVIMYTCATVCEIHVHTHSTLTPRISAMYSVKCSRGI